MKLVCIGDSLTYGFGVPSDSCWAKLIKLHFNIEVINKGINGDTTSGILSRSYRDIVEERPDYVTIMAGTNDILQGRSLNLAEDNMKLIVKEAKENKVTPIIALQPPIIASLARIYWGDDIDYEEAASKLSEYINWMKVYSSDNDIPLINFYDCFTAESKIDSLYSDGIHPNVQGHKLMFKKASELLNKILL